MSGSDLRVCVQICTFNRPQMLLDLLSALEPQINDSGALVVVVDNGSVSSEQIVAQYQDQFRIVYRRLSHPGVVVARNASLRLALESKAEYLAFIDDDEIPHATWLSSLVSVIESSGADIATGPVIPKYETSPPGWVTRGAYFHKSGETFCTSNMIMRASCLPNDERCWFQPKFNFSGGSDNELLNRLSANGASHVIASTAFVTEFIPRSRLTRRYIWSRGLRDGVVIAQIITLKGGSRVLVLARLVQRVLEKLAYSLNHLAWAAVSPWRINSAISDVAAAAGIVMRAAGIEFAFYGQTRKSEQRTQQSNKFN